MPSAQEWLDENYPINGTCVRKNEVSWLNNFGKSRKDIKQLFIANENLLGFLELVGFGNLTYLDCSSNQLTQLTLHCPNLIELICPYNQLINIILLAKNELKKLNCNGNPNLKSDFFLQLHPKWMTHLNLDGNLAFQLEAYLQVRERIGRKYGFLKSTLELAPGEVNYVTLLPRWQTHLSSLTTRELIRRWVFRQLRTKQSGEHFYLPTEIIEKIEEYSHLNSTLTHLSRLELVVFHAQVEQRVSY